MNLKNVLKRDKKSAVKTEEATETSNVEPVAKAELRKNIISSASIGPEKLEVMGKKSRAIWVMLRRKSWFPDFDPDPIYCRIRAFRNAST